MGSIAWLLVGFVAGALFVLLLDPGPPPAGSVPVVVEPRQPGPLAEPVSESAILARSLVHDERVADLQHEVTRWREYAERLEQQQPIEKCARVLGITTDDMRGRLDRSDLFCESDLVPVLESMTVEEVAKALTAEAEYYRQLRELKDQSAGAPMVERLDHHAARVIPWIYRHADDLSATLYELRCPSSIIRRFRDRLMEDI